jgi:hypothetical protein
MLWTLKLFFTGLVVILAGVVTMALSDPFSDAVWGFKIMATGAVMVAASLVLTIWFFL